MALRAIRRTKDAQNSDEVDREFTRCRARASGNVDEDGGG
jgi:hypothetical protein